MTFDPTVRVLPESPVAVPPVRGVVMHAENVTVNYDAAKRPALSNFDLEVKAGEFVSLLGQSGAGKTTALRTFAGFERVRSGYVRVGGRLVESSFTHVPPEKRRVGMVFQDYALFPHLTVQANIGFGLSGISEKAKKSQIGKMIEVTGLQGLEGRYAHELSGGQQQRVALARALAPNPVAVLLDEPFSNLDRQLRSRLRSEVRSILKETGATAVLVTHDREEALALADLVGIMNDGRIEQVGTPEQVYQRPATPNVASLVGPCDFIPGVLREGDIVETEAGVFPAAVHAERLAINSAVKVLMRASDLELFDASGEPDSLQLKITYREFRGEFTEFGISLPSGGSVRARHRSSNTFKEGDNVGIRPREARPMAIYPVGQ